MKTKPKIFTWNIHGSYLYYLTQIDCEFFIPVDEQKSEGFVGKSGPFAWGKNLHEVQVSKVRDLEIDLILLQSRKNYFFDQYKLLTSKQLSLPKIFIEHDPPRDHPTDSKHFINDPKITLVHVTNFNNLMWDSNTTPSTVIEHGVITPGATYKGILNKGIVVINNLKLRGRRLGLDVFEKIRTTVPLDLVGMKSEELGGLGEIPHNHLAEFISQYRFFFNPIRYTSLGLSVIESMMIGMPVIALATTEMVSTVKNNFSGYLSNDLDFLMQKMLLLIQHPNTAEKLGKNSRKFAKAKFNIERFENDWLSLFQLKINKFNQNKDKKQKIYHLGEKQ